MASDLVVRILGDASKLKQSFKEAESGAKTLADRVQGASQRMSSVGKVLSVGVTAPLVAFAGASVKAAAEAEQSQLRLTEAFRKFPKIADVSKASLGKLNTALAQKTKFDDDAIASGQASLAQFNLTGKQITSLTPLLLDYAAKTGKDVPSAADTLGKALLGQGRALKEIGIDFKDAGSVGGNFDQIMGGLRKQVGGFAAQEGKTAAGQIAIMRNRFGEIQETIGAQLLPVGTKLLGFLSTAINAFNNLSPPMQKAIIIVGGVAAAAGPLILVAAKLVTAIGTIGKAFSALTTLLSANPYILIIVATVALVILIVKNWDTIRSFLSATWEAIKSVAAAAWSGFKNIVTGAIRGVLDFFLEVAGKFLDAAVVAFGWIPGIGGKLKTAQAEFRNFRDSVNTSLGGIRDKTINLIVKQKGQPISAVAGTGTGNVHHGGLIPQAIRYHAGGLSGDEVPAILQRGEFVVNRQSVAHIGVGRLNQLNRLHAGGSVGTASGGGGNVYNITVHGADPKQVVEEINRRVRRNGGTGFLVA